MTGKPETTNTLCICRVTATGRVVCGEAMPEALARRLRDTLPQRFGQVGAPFLATPEAATKWATIGAPQPGLTP